MTAVVELFEQSPCRFSTTELLVLERLMEGARIHMIATELGLAEPVVREYVRAIMRKVGVESPQDVSEASILGG